MKKFLITSVLTLCILTGLSAQQKQLRTYQYHPEINKKSISGTITKITSSTLGKHELKWFHLGDIVIHVWGKDIKREMAVGKVFTFNGVQRLIGVRRHMEEAINPQLLGLTNAPSDNNNR